MSWRTIFGVCVLFLGITLAGCGEIETQIRTSYPLDTNDTKGPYQVMAVVNGEPGMKVWLVYTTDNWSDPNNIKVTEMASNNVDVFQGKIDGQAANTTISYYILVQSPANKVTTDPEQMTSDPEKLVLLDKDLTYQFRIVK